MMPTANARVLILKKLGRAQYELRPELGPDQARAELGASNPDSAPATPTLTPARVPALAQALYRQGAEAVLILDVLDHMGYAVHWLETAHARGWVYANGAIGPAQLKAAWLAHLSAGFVPADAALLAWPSLPFLSWGEAMLAARDLPPLSEATSAALEASPRASSALGLYAIADAVQPLRKILQAGVRTVQLRMKRPTGWKADSPEGRNWEAHLRAAIAESIALSQEYGAQLFINDHWELAAQLGAQAVHLGQEDLLALGDVGRAQLQATGLSLGVSSHAVWELCRARVVASAYLACGPIWPTTTKDMPWHPQGLDNLAWWCEAGQRPVVAIGGILGAEQVRLTAAQGASGVCVLRGLGDDPSLTVPALQAAFDLGRAQAAESLCVGEASHSTGSLTARQPHPSLDPEA